jgi:hypothetical protein
MKLNKTYFVIGAEVFDESVDQYLDNIDYNYAVVEGASGEPLCFDDGYPVIYADKEVAEEDAHEPGDYVITERELLEKFCKEEFVSARLAR